MRDVLVTLICWDWKKAIVNVSINENAFVVHRLFNICFFLLILIENQFSPVCSNLCLDLCVFQLLQRVSEFWKGILSNIVYSRSSLKIHVYPTVKSSGSASSQNGTCNMQYCSWIWLPRKPSLEFKCIFILTISNSFDSQHSTFRRQRTLRMINGWLHKNPLLGSTRTHYPA